MQCGILYWVFLLIVGINFMWGGMSGAAAVSVPGGYVSQGQSAVLQHLRQSARAFVEKKNAETDDDYVRVADLKPDDKAKLVM